MGFSGGSNGFAQRLAKETIARLGFDRHKLIDVIPNRRARTAIGLESLYYKRSTFVFPARILASDCIENSTITEHTPFRLCLRINLQLAGREVDAQAMTEGLANTVLLKGIVRRARRRSPELAVSWDRRQTSTLEQL
ncbi:MAG: hypothetical protein CMJ48_04105 [Planctomycetaceae bacterium]|nr:hypothetical protein [Planctomycetaceae bacterium]